MKPFVCTYFLAVTLAAAGAAQAQQTAAADSSALASSIAYTQQLQAAEFGPGTYLLNGANYLNYSRANYVGHQFFVGDVPQEGSLRYDGFFYPRLLLLYDIKLDQLLVSLAAPRPTLSLVSEKVAEFTLYSRKFIYLPALPGLAATAKPGFYNLLADGPARLLAKRRKTLREETERTVKEGLFTEQDFLVLQAGGSNYLLATEQDLLRALPARKAELRAFARKRHLKYDADNRENSLVALVSYYNSLP